MLRSAASKAMSVGRFASAVFGLALVLALVFGAASVALAANGQPFLLGRATNAATALTKLTANVNGSAMQVQNTNAGSDDTALSLTVQPGETPMRVNSDARVAKLNSDKIDGKDSAAFFSGKIYAVRDSKAGLGGGQLTAVGAACDAGDVVLGGGGGASDSDAIREDTVNFSHPVSDDIWNVLVRDNDPATVAFAEARCADFPPLRP